MKHRLLLITLLLTINFACEKNSECDDKDLTCYEAPPVGELCDAYFTRWFYNEETNSCEQIGYSGCSSYGFETKEECENCECK